MFARHAHRLFALALIATSSAASDLVVSVDHHVVYQKAEPRSLYVVFLDEPLVAAVKLDAGSDDVLANISDLTYVAGEADRMDARRGQDAAVLEQSSCDPR